MTTPTIQFRDAIGAVTITAQGLSLNNWLPDVDEVGDRAVPMGTGLEGFWRYRRDFTASFEMPHVKAANLTNLHRLKSHMLTGGFITVSTNDSASRVYTCSVKPGSTPSWSFADRQQLEYTLSLEVRNVMPYPMICDYSAFGGTSGNLIVNGGGETGTVGSVAPSWTTAQGDGLYIDSSAHLGARSLAHEFQTFGGCRANQAISVTAGQRYLFAGWVKLGAIISGDQSAGIPRGGWLIIYDDVGTTTLAKRHGAIYGTSTKPSAGVAAITAVTDWAYIALLIDATATGSIDVSVESQASVTGVSASFTWYDDLRFEAVPAV